MKTNAGLYLLIVPSVLGGALAIFDGFCIKNPSDTYTTLIWIAEIMLEAPALIAVFIMALAFHRLNQYKHELEPVSKKQIWLQLAANSLYTIFFPASFFFNFKYLPWLITTYFWYFFLLFGLAVLTKTLCELVDLQYALETVQEAHITNSNDLSVNSDSDLGYSQVPDRKDYRYSDALQFNPNSLRKSDMTIDESSLYEHMLGKTSAAAI